ncbi:hypothetical protein N431DRAFT_465767 [Stipitochalara longipes BDJ]|nr:hypothetical protein N431DRAFT_465767 [Stipitochalara longipes BDJ]
MSKNDTTSSTINGNLAAATEYLLEGLKLLKDKYQERTELENQEFKAKWEKRKSQRKARWNEEVEIRRDRWEEETHHLHPRSGRLKGIRARHGEEDKQVSF